MIFETIKSEGIAQLSYLVGDADASQCVVIDPRRDVQVYIDRARALDATIVGVFETHLHADFLSGALVLSRLTGAPLYSGPSDDRAYDATVLDDGESVSVGALTFTAYHTPGHSPEHQCFVVAGGKGAEEPWGVFTGDTLFAGSVGRPDLASGWDKQDLARALYDSITETLLPLGDELIVYPGHGSGSPCGGNIGDREVSTLGYERKFSDKLAVDTKEAFVDKVLADLPDEPAYYPRMKKLNSAGQADLAEPPRLEPRTPEELAERLEREELVVLDTREVTDFHAAHIDGARNIAARTAFDPWAGRILDPDVPIVLVCDDWSETENIHRRLFRIGFDNVDGFLEGGIRRWIGSGRQTASIHCINVHDLDPSKAPASFQLLDVRTDEEWESGRIANADHIFAAELRDRLSELDPSRPIAVYCGSDFRASIAASILARHGFSDVTTVLGSFGAWSAAGREIVS